MAKKKHTYNNEISPKKGFLITEDSEKVNWITGRKNFVDIPHGFKDKHVMKLWCEQNCQYPVVYFKDNQQLKWKSNFNENDSIARMYFFSEEDTMAFKLRWRLQRWQRPALR